MWRSNKKKALQLEALIKNAGLAMIATDKNRCITSVNRAAEIMFGYNEDELIGKEIEVLFSDRNPPELLKELREKGVRGESWEANLWRKRRDGSEILTWLSSSFLFDERGKMQASLGIAKDITREQEIEERLRILGELIDTASICILTTDREGYITSINRAGEELYGYRSDEIIGKNVRILFSERDSKALIKKLDQKRIDGESWEAEVWRKRKGGAEVLTWLSTSYLFDGSGRMRSALGIARDITHEKETEERLRILGDLIETASICILTTDNEGRITGINRAGEKLYGYRADEIIGKDVKILFSDRNPRSLIELLDEKKIEGESWEAEVWRKRKDGAEILTWLSTSYLFDGDGRLRGALGIAKDITRGREMEEMLRYMSELIDSASLGIIYTDKDNRVLSINKAGEKMLGYKAAEIMGKNVSVLFADETPSRLVELIRKKAERGESWDAEVFRKRKNGEVFPAWVSTFYLLDEHGRKRGGMSIARDLTEIKQMEKDLVRADRLATIGTLATTVAHEIRNPLAGIEMGLEALGGNVREDKENAQIIETLHDEVMRLNEVVSRLLEYGRKRSDNIQPCDVVEVLRKCFFFLHKQIEENKVSLEWDIDRKLWKLNADEAYLQQAFMNIMLNAVQAMKGGGRLRIAAKGASIQGCRSLEVSFEDTGEGIASEDIPKIFDPFVSTKAEGTGLGLSVSEKIISEYGGKIDVKSKKGEGTCVKVIFPVDWRHGEAK